MSKDQSFTELYRIVKKVKKDCEKAERILTEIEKEKKQTVAYTHEHLVSHFRKGLKP